MFSIRSEKFGKSILVKLINTTTREYFSFIPTFGATINDLVLMKKGQLCKLLYSSIDHNDLVTKGKRIFNGAKLFPFPNRINNGKYIWNNKEYHLPINFPYENHAIHGLVLESKFKIVKRKSGKNIASVEIVHDYNGKSPGYPFKYRLQVIYSFSKNEVKVKTIATNTDKVAIPIGDGWHPYFQTGTKIDNLHLLLPSNEIVEMDKKMIPTGKIVYSNQFATKLRLIGNHTFDTCYRIIPKNKTMAQIVLKDPGKNITIVVWLETGRQKYNYVQIYTPPSRKYIAIEPMSCAPDVFNNKEGLIILKPKEKYRASFGIKLE